MNLPKKTIQQITIEINNVISDVCGGCIKQKDEVMKKLYGYIYIERIYELNYGRFYRWFNEKNELATGGILVSVNFQDSGVYLLLKVGRSFRKISFNNCILFQKLTNEDQFHLFANYSSENSSV